MLQYRDPVQKSKSDGSQQLTHPAQNGTLRHQWTQEPDNCDKQIVISVPMAERQKENAIQQKEIYLRKAVWEISTAKRSTSDTKTLMDLNKSWKQQDLTPPTTDTRQMVRATASSPIDKPHLRTLSIGRDPLQKQNLKDLNKGHSFPTTRTRPNNQWVWWKHQDADPPTKSWQHPKIVPLTVAPMLLQHKRLTVSNMLLQKRDPPRNSNGSQPLNASVKAWQQHHKRIDLVYLQQTKYCSAPRSTSKTNWMELTETAASTHQSPEGRTFNTAKFKHFW